MAQMTQHIKSLKHYVQVFFVDLVTMVLKPQAVCTIFVEDLLWLQQQLMT